MSAEFENIDIIVPIYNEEKNVIPLIEHIDLALQEYFSQMNIILIDDGSTDDTEAQLTDYKPQNPKLKIKYVKLAKNYGKDKALKCGIDYSDSDVCAMIDADFQHPPEKIIEAIESIKNGYSIVHIVKKDYNIGGIYRKIGSSAFIRVVNFLSGSKINLTDFKVLDRKAVGAIKSFKEAFYFSAGIIDMIGLKATRITYEPQDRKYGSSKFNMLSLFKLALQSIMAISVKPLRISIYTGIAISSLSLIYGLYILGEKIVLGQPIPGFATLATALFFTSGIQLLFLGIIGEYLGKTFIEAKQRPQYLIDNIIEL